MADERAETLQELYRQRKAVEEKIQEKFQADVSLMLDQVQDMIDRMETQ